ncbi:magnesium-transporting ATPase (P-type) [Luteibacter sp. Sphag1AF]|uniref:DUF3325 domain-containing protein n=1 Tax=Luteibacter sp. Sphag1AF TaxID=2587031 RepID=UPI00160CDFD8|nr:DUF3325 domain-containing protein [Luteibacter sp. Sphag1AF]MBB3228080.1 magnesium-transporting ATPase (P-type) [Luteibacter sp. Sphag1AF]
MSVVALAYVGFVALMIAMEKHHEELMQARPTPARRRVWRWAGWAALCAAMAVAMYRWGGPVGFVAFAIGCTVAAVLLVFVVLVFCPRWTVPLMTAAAVATAVLVPLGV